MWTKKEPQLTRPGRPQTTYDLNQEHVDVFNPKVMKNLIVLAFLISSCSMIEEPEYSVDPQLKQYVDNFYSEMESRDIYKSRWNLVVRFGDKSHSFKKGRQRIVEINREQFQRFIEEDYVIYGDVYHELGHALLDLEHKKEVSLMNYTYTHTSYLKVTCTKELFLDELILGTVITEKELFKALNDCPR